MSPAEKLRELTSAINQTLADMGYEPVTVEYAHLDNAYGEYDWDADKVRLDRDHVRDGDFADVLNTAYHEAAHAIEDQDGSYAAMTEEEKADYTNEALNFVPDGDDFTTASELYHAEVRQFAEYETELALETCKERSAESSTEEAWEFTMDDLEAFDAPAEPGVSEEDIEIEMGTPIIRDESESDEAWFTMGEPIITTEQPSGGTNLETPARPGTAGSGP